MSDRKIDILLHPIRMRIITQLINRQMTAQQLAKTLTDVAQATLYRHINTLEEADILQIVGEEQIRGTVEKTYALKENAARLTPEEIANLTPQEHLHFFTVFAMGLIGDFSRMIEQVPDEQADWAFDVTRYNKIALNLSDEEAAEMRETVTKLVQRAASNPPAPNRKRYLLSLVTLPDVDDLQENDQ